MGVEFVELLVEFMRLGTLDVVLVKLVLLTHPFIM